MKMVYRKTLIPDGIYEARIKSIEEVETEKQPLIRITATLETNNPELNGLLVSTLVGRVFASHTRFVRWFEAATGQKLSDQTEVELDDMLDQQIAVTVENQENNRGEVYANIVKIEPRS